jgi:ABC-2 type transport system ATP-binding protein
VAEFIKRNSVQSVRVRTPEPDLLASVVLAAGGATMPAVGGSVVVQGLPVNQIGDLAFEHRIRLHELAPARASLEEAFMELTADSVEFHAYAPGQSGEHAASDSDRVHTTGVA